MNIEINLKLSKRAMSAVPKVVLTSLFVLGIFTTNAYAAPANLRLAGTSRYDTAVAIAESGWAQSDYAILAYGNNFPDALSAAPLAKKYNAPILLTESATLTPQTRQALIDLKVKNVVIVGGTGVISQNVEDSLKGMAIALTRLAGYDRYDTSVKIAEQLGPVTSVAVVAGGGFADALSVGAVAGESNMPVVLVPKDTVPASISTYLATQNIANSYVVGGTAVVSDEVLNSLPNAQRISGTDRYATNIAVLNKFSSTFASTGVCVATGDGFADALTGTAYAIKNSLPIVLLPSGSDAGIKSYIASKSSGLSKVVILGGEGVVSSNLINAYFAPVKTVVDVALTQALYARYISGFDTSNYKGSHASQFHQMMLDVALGNASASGFDSRVLAIPSWNEYVAEYGKTVENLPSQGVIKQTSSSASDLYTLWNEAEQALTIQTHGKYSDAIVCYNASTKLYTVTCVAVNFAYAY